MSDTDTSNFEHYTNISIKYSPYNLIYYREFQPRASYLNILLMTSIIYRVSGSASDNYCASVLAYRSDLQSTELSYTASWLRQYFISFVSKIWAKNTDWYRSDIRWFKYLTISWCGWEVSSRSRSLDEVQIKYYSTLEKYMIFFNDDTQKKLQNSIIWIHISRESKCAEFFFNEYHRRIFSFSISQI